jgi:hypothetical protein
VASRQAAAYGCADLSYRFGMIIVPGRPKKLDKLMVSLVIDKRSIASERILPVLFIGILYDAPGFDEARVTLEAFRLSTGEKGKTGLSNEFISPGVYLKDLATPLRFVRISPIDQISKLT